MFRKIAENKKNDNRTSSYLSPIKRYKQANKQTNSLPKLKRKMMKILKEEFVRRINHDDTYTLNDLKKILGEVYKEVAIAQKEEGKKKREKRERDENGEIIKKRPASAYNLFIKEQSAIIKAANPTLDSKAVFKMAIDEWKKKKEQVDNEPKQVDDKPASNPVPEPHSQHQPEPQPQPDEKNDTNITVEPEPQPEPQPEEKKTKKARKPKKTTETTDDE